MDRGDNVTPQRAAEKDFLAPDRSSASSTSNESSSDGSAPLGTLERGLHLLGLFTAERPGWTLRDLREESGLPKATVRRIVMTLERYGWLAADERTGLYGLGPTILQGLFAKTSASLLADVARPYLQELARVTTESALFSVWGHSGPLTLDLVTTERHFKPFTSIGMVMEGAATADAQVLNAFAPPSTQQARLAALFPEGSVEESERAAVVDLWAEVRRTGVAFDLERWRPGVCAVAAPVLQGPGEVIASVSVVLPSERADHGEMKSHASAVQDTARAISTALRTRSLPA